MTQPQDQNDPATPPEDVTPVPVEETDEPAPEPGQDWGTKGEGGDAEDDSSPASPQDNQGGTLTPEDTNGD